MEKIMMSLLGLFGLMIFVMDAKTVNGIECGEAVAQLQPCQIFLAGPDPSPSPPCCLAVDNLNKEASTKAIRQLLCECFKQVAPSIGVKPDKAKELPDMCHVPVPVPIDPSIDCSKIS